MSLPALHVSPNPAQVDQRVHLHRVPWRQYEALLAMRGEASVPRIAYLEGELELMTPAWTHEDLKKRLARLVEAWSDAAGVELVGGGSWTLKKKAVERGAEPDECYVRGVPKGEPERPDFVIEIVWTSGGLDKLAIYSGLGIGEVWFWRDGLLSIHALEGDRYAEVEKSRVIPELDPDLLVRFMLSDLSQGAAARALRQEIEGGR